MNKGERRNRTAKIADKRFRQLYCNYHGTPERWFYRADKKKQAKRKGQCRDRIYSWRCRCEWCRGGSILKQDIADLELMEGLDEALHMNTKINQSVHRINYGIGNTYLDWQHELWFMFVKPYHRRSINGSAKHHL